VCIQSYKNSDKTEKNNISDSTFLTTVYEKNTNKICKSFYQNVLGTEVSANIQRISESSSFCFILIVKACVLSFAEF